MNAKDLAGFLYAKYCDTIGGKGPDGKNLPMWAEFSEDPTKQVEVTGWFAVAVRAIELLGTKKDTW
jgi:hypothetical protein